VSLYIQLFPSGYTVGVKGWYTGLLIPIVHLVYPTVFLGHVRFTVLPHLGRNLGAGRKAAVSCVALTVPWSKRVLFVTVSRRPFLAPVPNAIVFVPWGLPKYTETHVTMLILSVRGMIGSRLLLK
jgi:hypothetical protein